MSPSKILLYFCLSFIGGIFVSSIIFVPQILMLVIFVLGIVLISVFWPPPQHVVAGEARKKIVVASFCLLILVAGIWRYQLALSKIENNKLRKFNDQDREITLLGIVAAEPDIRSNHIKLTIGAKEIIFVEAEPRQDEEEPTEDEFVEAEPRQIEGKILVTTNRYPKYQYGDKLKITGFLKTPQVFEGFNYRGYLAKDGIYSVIYWPKIEQVASGFGSPLMKVLFSFKNKFKETTEIFFSPPQSGILQALIFGDESDISKNWKEKLNLTGTRHITAVSGMNITIISFLILNFLLGLGLWRQQAFYLSIFLILFYILMIGAPTSAIRAGIMAGLLLTAQHFGRLSVAYIAVTFAAFLMLLQNPLLLKFDVGFQFSFLAIIGLIYLQPYFLKWLKSLPNPKLFPVRSTLSATLAAQIFALPILIYNFGNIPLVSPLTNSLIVPFIAPITIFLFIFGFLGMIFSPLGYILSWPSWLFLTYIVIIVEWFSELSLASITLENVHWIWVLVSYLILGFFVWQLEKRNWPKILKF